MILALAPVDSFALGLTFVFGFSSDSVVVTPLLCNSLLVALLEEEVVVALIPVTRVSNGKGGWTAGHPPFSASALLLSSLA